MTEYGRDPKIEEVIARHQTIAHEPEKPKEEIDIPDYKGRTLSRLALLGVGTLAACDVITNSYHFLHACVIESLIYPTPIKECATEINMWLPYALRHLIK